MRNAAAQPPAIWLTTSSSEGTLSALFPTSSSILRSAKSARFQSRKKGSLPAVPACAGGSEVLNRLRPYYTLALVYLAHYAHRAARWRRGSAMFSGRNGPGRGKIGGTVLINYPRGTHEKRRSRHAALCRLERKRRSSQAARRRDGRRPKVRGSRQGAARGLRPDTRPRRQHR